MFKLPFGWLPGSWGLKGKTYLIAKAEYELSGIDLDYAIAEINFGTDEVMLSKERLKIQKKHKIITESEYEYELAKIENKDDTQRSLILLELDLKNNKIDQTAYDKAKATILKEPWVSIPKIHWDPLSNGKTFFELDYNEYLIPYLKNNGYSGADDDIINSWINDVCIAISQETGANDTFVLPAKRPPEN